MCVCLCVCVCVAVWLCGCVAVWLWLRASQANAIWEANLMAGWVKPAPSAPQPTIEKWIRTKYQWKGFLGPQSDTVAVLSERLFASVEAGDIDSVYRYLAYGADVGWQAPEVPPPDDGAPPARPGGSALHRAAELGNVRVCVCLCVCVCLRRATHATTSRVLRPCCHPQEVVVELLCQHGASITALDARLSSALDRALHAKQHKIVALLEAKLKRGEL